MKKLLGTILGFTMIMTSVISVNASDISSTDSDKATGIESVLTVDELNELTNTLFTPDNQEAFDDLSENQLIGIVGNCKILKSNLNEDYTVNIKSLTPVSYVGEPTPVTRAVSETYKALPSGYYSAYTYWTVSAPSFYQQTTSYYLTNSLAKSFYAKSHPGFASQAISILVKAGLGVAGGVPATIAIAVLDIGHAAFDSDLSRLINQGKKVEIRLAKTNYGKFSSVFNWTNNKIRLRNGTKDLGAGYKTVEKTTYSFSKSK